MGLPVFVKFSRAFENLQLNALRAVLLLANTQGAPGVVKADTEEDMLVDAVCVNSDLIK